MLISGKNRVETNHTCRSTFHLLCVLSSNPAAGFLDRLIAQQRQGGGSELSQHLLPQALLQRKPLAVPDPHPLLPLLRGTDSANAADVQPEQLPYAVEMHLRERRAALQQAQQQQKPQQSQEHPPPPPQQHVERASGVFAHKRSGKRQASGCAEEAAAAPADNQQVWHVPAWST